MPQVRWIEKTVNVPHATSRGKKGHGAVMAGKAKVRKGKKQPRR